MHNRAIFYYRCFLFPDSIANTNALNDPSNVSIEYASEVGKLFCFFSLYRLKFKF